MRQFINEEIALSRVKALRKRKEPGAPTMPTMALSYVPPSEVPGVDYICFDFWRHFRCK